jgi:type II secretory pathway pseudopilin PulG
LTICPCCGFKFHGALSSGCRQCGARAIGEPLPKPAHELPSYGRSLLLAVSGSLVVVVFLVQTIIAFVQKFAGSFGFWTWVAAGETAAWRLKWVSIPVLFVTVWLGRKLDLSILHQPERFCGVKYARHGLVASSTVVALMALLIGITVPARLEHRRWSKEAAARVQGYIVERALTEYRIKYHTYPADLQALVERVPDPDGSLAAALQTIDPGTYRPTVELAVNGTGKSRRLSGSMIRKTSFSPATDDAPLGGLTFINYSIVLPGEDGISGNEDDWIVRDGMIMKQSEIAKGGVGRSVSAGILQP